MEVLGHSFQGTIEDILNLNVVSEERCYNLNEIEMFQSISNLDTWGLNLETEDKLTEKDVIRDLTNDGRSRQLSILLYDNQPFALYQYMGRGNVENEVIFNKEVYLDFLKAYMTEYVEKKSSMTVADLQQEYTASNYDFGVFIMEDNTITSVCKTTLDTVGQ